MRIQAYVIKKVAERLQSIGVDYEMRWVQPEILIGSDYYWDMVKETPDVTRS